MDFTQIIQTFIALGIGILFGVGLGYIFLPHIRDYFDEKGAQKRKLVELLSARGRISPDEAAKYLDIPLPSAEQELRELEKRDIVRRVKNTGNDIIYQNTPR